jgi:U4/U6 small nuclear ribonucleoprotein PRP31
MADGTTTTLADTLLDDLDDLDDLSDVEEENDEADETSESAPVGNDENELSIKSSYVQDSALHAHLKAIRESAQDNELIIPSNKYLARLATELATAHQDLIDAYKPKFPDLADLVMDPLSYKNAVQQIGNEMDVTRIDLSSILSPNQVITISVASSTTTGRPLTEDELKNVDQACRAMEELWEVQTELTTFVRNRMNDWAPSTSAVVGPAIAAKLIGMAGGLTELSRIPACNLQVLGQVKANAAARAGLSTISTKPHTGILNDCDLVQSCPSYLQKKALKVVAAKLALAVRCDFVDVNTGRARSSASGEAFRVKVEEQIQKWQTPDKAQVLKALPK